MRATAFAAGASASDADFGSRPTSTCRRGRLMVVKRDGRREELDRNKLYASLTKACAKRPLAIGSIEKVIADIETQIANLGRAEVPSEAIGELVMERLRNLDRVPTSGTPASTATSATSRASRPRWTRCSSRPGSVGVPSNQLPCWTHQRTALRSPRVAVGSAAQTSTRRFCLSPNPPKEQGWTA